MKKIAFLGLGVMGKYMATNLLKSNYFESVQVWNRNNNSVGVQFAVDHGAKSFTSATGAIIGAQAVCICVSNAAAVNDILFGEKGIGRHLEKGTIVIDFSTIGKEPSEKIRKKLAEDGIKFVDVPVSGGDIGAEKGTLTLMVGAGKEDFPELEKIFNSVGKNIFYCGKPGSGQLIKSINQLLCGIHMVAISEAFYMAEEVGIDKQLVVDICSTGAAGSWALTNLGSEIAKGNFEPGFMIKHMQKDMNIISDTNIKNISLPGFEYAKKMFGETGSLLEGEGVNLGTQAMFLTYKK